MKDLCSTLFYKIKFNIAISGDAEESDLLWIIVKHIKDWMTHKHNKPKEKEALSSDSHDWTLLKNGGIIQGRDIKIASEFCLVEEPFNASFWACKIVEFPKASSGKAPRKWTTEIGFEPVSPDKASFSCIIYYNDFPGFLGEYEDAPNPSVPKLINSIWNDKRLICTDGIDKPTIVPKKLVKGDWNAFWERLTNSERTMPYIYISPLNRHEDGEAANLIDPQSLARAVGANAIIYFADDKAVTDEMNRLCPEEYICYGGALRVYYPNLNIDNPNDQRKHRFLSSGYIRNYGSEHIIQVIRRAIAQNADFYDKIFRVEDCRQKREAIIRKKKLEELKRQHNSELESREESALELAMEAEDLAKTLDDENKQLRDENYTLRLENSTYIGLAKENADLKRVSNNRLSIKEYPSSPQDIVNYFDATFCDKIAFSEDAISSLKDCTIPLDELWKCFFALANVMRDLYEYGEGDIFKTFREKTGIEAARGEGAMTRKDKRLMRQFETEYHGKAVDIEAHITYPKLGQSIHFGYLKEENKLIVGWCGGHKEIASTRKHH